MVTSCIDASALHGCRAAEQVKKGLDGVMRVGSLPNEGNEASEFRVKVKRKFAT